MDALVWIMNKNGIWLNSWVVNSWMRLFNNILENFATEKTNDFTVVSVWFFWNMFLVDKMCLNCMELILIALKSNSWSFNFVLISNFWFCYITCSLNFRKKQDAVQPWTTFTWRCPWHTFFGHELAASLSCERGPHHPAVLPALPLHQHVAVQHPGEGAASVLYEDLGPPPQTSPRQHRGVGGETGTGAGRRLSPV